MVVEKKKIRINIFPQRRSSLVCSLQRCKELATWSTVLRDFRLFVCYRFPDVKQRCFALVLTHRNGNAAGRALFVGVAGCDVSFASPLALRCWFQFQFRIQVCSLVCYELGTKWVVVLIKFDFCRTFILFD